MKKLVLLSGIFLLTLTAGAETYLGEVFGKNGGYVLTEPGNTKQTIANFAWTDEIREAVAPYEGKVVRVTGTLKPDANWPTLQSINLIEEVVQ